MQIYGYARVSSADQNEQRQIDILKKIIKSENNILVDKQSGKDFDRPNYKKMVQTLKKGLFK